jgi:peptidoglycan/LPS O-acetylase OafA/YrhL/lysophospholipase L1-like esterase
VAVVDTPTRTERTEPVLIDLRTRRGAGLRLPRLPARPPGTSPDRPPIALTYQPAIDGLRGLAVAGVLLFHAGFSWAVGGYLGVSTFFTLSGYLITTLLLAEHQRSGRVSLLAFWGRRFRRLMPASLLTLAGIVLLFGPFVADADQLAELPGDVLAALAYVANWRFIAADQSYADLFTAPSPVQHFWSLAIEEQYYLFFPLLMTGLLAAGRGSRRVLLGALGALAVGSTLLMVTLYTPGTDTARVYYGTDTRAVELLAGALLAVVLASRPDLLRRVPPRLATVAGAAVLALTAYWWMTVEQTSSWLFQGGLTLYALTTVVLLTVLLTPGPVTRLLATEPLRQLGRISYGVYLLHWPIFLWLTPERTDLRAFPLFVLRVAVTIGAAVLSFRLVEQPVRTRHALVGPRNWLVAPVAVLVLVVGVVTLGAVTEDEQDEGLGAILDASPDAQDPEDLLAAAPDAADTSTVPTVDRVLLVGDSVMGQAYEVFRTVFEDRGILTGYAGGPSTGPLQPQGDWARQIDEWVQRFDPDVVVMEACCDYTQATDQVYVDPAGNEVLPATDAVYPNWEREVRDLTRRAQAGGAHVIWVLAPPVQTNGFYGPLEGHVARVNEIYRRLPVPVIDWSTAVAPNGEYTDEVTGLDGGPCDVRLADGVHMSECGNRLLADLTLAQVQAVGEHPTF